MNDQLDIIFQPIGEFLLIKQDPGSNKIGSIIVETVSNRPPQSGTVLLCGSKCVNVVKGDRVQFELGEFRKVILDGTEYLLVKESKIIGVFEKEDE